MMCVHTKSIHIRISKELLHEIDEAAKANYTTRSDYIRNATLIQLKYDTQTEAQKDKKETAIRLKIDRPSLDWQKLVDL